MVKVSRAMGTCTTSIINIQKRTYDDSSVTFACLQNISMKTELPLLNFAVIIKLTFFKGDLIVSGV